jgi:YHS domain-containing protein
MIWFCACIAVAPLHASTTERIVTDYHTGLAISGFDPVGYFTEGRAIVGSSEFEAPSAGATWRFINEGNREAFLANPEVYTPVFGGYDPTGVARGVAAAGHPQVWLIVGERLYLFRNAQTRTLFAADPEHFLANAQSQWPMVVRTLVQ